MIAFVGISELGECICKENGIDEVFAISKVELLDEELKTENAINNLREAVCKFI